MKVFLDYQNRRVRLTDERRQHILLHPEMAAMEQAIERTVRQPQHVIRSRSDAETELLYRFYRQTIVGDKWLCVVVRYSNEDAFVLTAYLTDSLKTGEALWPKP